ncbi:hypothetical protein [Pedobacter alpinus]|uniref:Tetratricopeptide repeat-containing protein n=1 Tax=Pedobacter alpinus TaxID=1590643 RepID=A0ABW5TRD2_9SPHI
MKKPTYKYLPLLFLIISTSLQSCIKENKLFNDDFEVKISQADSLLTKAKEDEALSLLKTINIKEYESEPRLASYYILMSNVESPEPGIMINHAKSALDMFENNESVEQHKDLYFQSLVANGDVYYRLKNFLKSLSFYLEAENYIEGDSCKKGYLYIKICYNLL